jgi:threonine aldolase
VSTVVDLRSDTVTKPTAGMRKAMAEAEVGDDVYGEDPTVRRLEERVAALLGKEAALFVPSGSMANMIAVRVHTEASDEVILEAMGHSYAYEAGGMAGISGVQARPLPTPDGLLSPEQVEAAINPKNAHFARTRLVIVENTSNRGGGTIYTPEHIERMKQLTERHELALHMDGARLWNAHVALSRPLDDFTQHVASVSVCLSKGLGCPVGSLLAGTRAFIERAHRFRKMLGGGMRQVGILAAAGLYALDHHLARLEEDHARLARLTGGLAQIPGLSVQPKRHPTNIGFVELEPGSPDAKSFVERLRAHGVLANATGTRSLRVLTHLDVDDASIERALDGFRRALA